MSIKNVAAVVCGMDEEYPYHIILGINKFAQENSINISYFAAFGGIVDSRGFDAGEYSIYNLPDFSSFDGALLLTNTFSNPKIRNSIIDKVKAAGIPSVIFECKEYPEFYDISINNYSVMKKLVEHLIVEHGAKTFNFIAGPEANPEARERLRAFREALSEHGLEFDEKNRLFQGCFRSYDGIKAIDYFVETGVPLPDAIVCANDSMALTAMSKLQGLGYNIPEDVIITGFDNTFNAQNSSPVLTTVKRPLFYSGEKACETLLNLMTGIAQPRSTDLEAEPVFAESCGCVNGDNAEDIRRFKRDTYNKLEKTYTTVHMLNRLIAGLASAENIEECIASIQQMLTTINCDHFSLCLVNNWENKYDVASLEEEQTEYPPVMTAPMIWDNGNCRSIRKFPSRQLRPEPFTTGGNISYYIPLHFGQRCLGYFIMDNTDFPIYSMHCHTLAMSIGNAIEGISKLNVLDPLCGIYNRNGFNKNAGYVFNGCIMDRRPLSVLFIDMDGLKEVNDTYGHKEGDFALKSIAESMTYASKSTDVCGRLGGDEFVVVGRGDDFVENFKERFRAKLDKINNESDKPYIVDVSIGSITYTPSIKDTLFDLIEQADAKMYEIKKEKKKQRNNP